MSTFQLQFTWRCRKQKFTISKTSTINPLPESRRSSQLLPLENEIIYLGRNALIPFPPSCAINTSPRPSRNIGTLSYSMTAAFWGSQGPVSPTKLSHFQKTLPNLFIRYILTVTQQLFIIYLLCTMPTTVLEAVDTKINKKNNKLLWSLPLSRTCINFLPI